MFTLYVIFGDYAIYMYMVLKSVYSIYNSKLSHPTRHPSQALVH